MSWSAAILAGGRARRLGGRDKRALDVGGLRLIERQLAVLTSLTTRITCVGGMPGAASAGLACVPDLMPGLGALGGLHTALAIATTDRVLVLACDLPFVTAPFLAFLLDVDPQADAVVPVPASGPQPLCAVYRTRAASVLKAAIGAGERRVRDAVARLAPRWVDDEALRRFDADGRLLLNVNTPDDLADANRLESNGPHRTAGSGTSQTTNR